MDTDVHARAHDIEELSKENIRLRQVVDEQARRLEAMHATEGRLRQLTDFAPVTVWMSGLDGETIHFNRTWHELTGLPESSSRSWGWATLLHDEDRERCTNAYWHAFDTREPFRLKYRIRRRDGEYRWVLEQGNPRTDEQGEFAGFSGACVDITELQETAEALRQSEARSMIDTTARKEAEQLLKDSEERLRMALDGGQIGTWDWDLATHAVRWGGHAYRVFDLVSGVPSGYSLRAASGGTFDDFLEMVHPDDRHALLEAVNHAIDLSLPFDVEFRTNPRGTQLRWVASQAQVFCDERGKPARMLGVVQDVTERKRLESQFLQAQKMEGIGRLAGGVAHDFNNLLTAILGYIEMATKKLPADNPSMEYFHSIRHAAERSAALTRQLLAFARRQITEPRLVDLNTLIEQMHDLLRRVIGEDIELRSVVHPGLGAVKLDPAQFEQVLMNLVINARDAMPDGGILSIETGNVELDEHYARQHQAVLPGPYVMLAVSDTGIGMTEEVSSHLFEPFFTTKPPGKGTGLGLATCYGIIKQNGGNIWVYSEHGRGSTFKIFLPRASGVPSADAAPEAPEVEVTGHETVMVVEDEPLVRAITVETLETLGYRVLQASNGEEALGIANAHDGPIDVLVTDVVMPAMGGPALTQHLHRVRPNMKVLYVSGYTDDAIVHHGVVEPGVQFLQKPFPLATLARRIRELLATRAEGTLALPFDR